MTLLQCDPLDRAIGWLRATPNDDTRRAAALLEGEPNSNDVALAIAIAGRYAPRALHDLGVVLTVLAEPGGDPPPPRA